MMPLQVPVASSSAAMNAATAPLEADVLQQGLLLTHLREQQVREEHVTLWRPHFNIRIPACTGMHMCPSRECNRGRSAHGRYTIVSYRHWQCKGWCMRVVQALGADVGRQLQEAEKASDKALLKLYQATLKDGKLARALEAAAQLALPAALNGALTLANRLG